MCVQYPEVSGVLYKPFLQVKYENIVGIVRKEKKV